MGLLEEIRKMGAQLAQQARVIKPAASAAANTFVPGYRAANAVYQNVVKPVNQRVQSQGGYGAAINRVKQTQPIKNNLYSDLAQGRFAGAPLNTGFKPLNKAGQITGGFVQNRLIQPVLNIPANVRTMAQNAPEIVRPGNTGTQRLQAAGRTGMAALQTAGAFSPGPEDVALGFYDSIKAKLAGKSAMGGFTGQQQTGLGETLPNGTSDRVRNFANVAELPLMVGAQGLKSLQTAKKLKLDQAAQGLAKEIGGTQAQALKLLEQNPNLSGQAGIIKVGKDFRVIHPEDRARMVDLIDYVRLGGSRKQPNFQLELDARRIAENYGIKMPKNLAGLATQFDKTLSSIKKVTPNKWLGQAGFARLGSTKSPGLEEPATSKGIEKLQPTLGNQGLPGGGQPSGGENFASGIITGKDDPVNKIIQAIREAKPIRGQQEALYSKARSQQAARIAGVGGRTSGEKGYFAQLGQLKGELPRAQFEGIRSKIKQPEIDALFNMVEQKEIFSPFEKVNAKTALSKLLGAEGGTVPTKSELSLLSEVFPPEMIDAIQSQRSTFQKLLSLGKDALNIPRAMMATGDLSAPLRQGIFLVGRPKQWGPAFKNMFKYAGSENAYKGLTEEIQARPTYKLMRQNKLALTDMGSNLSTREEQFMSTLPEKIPVFGSIAKGSNRAYSGFLNKLRADTFDDMYKSASEQGLVKDNPKLVEDIANFVNTATGRGNLGSFQKAAEILNATLFAPRLVASRMSLLNPVYYAKLDPFVRKEALKSLLSFVGLGSTVLGAAKMGGADVETNPTSSDFGKIKIGNTRYDIWGGFQQYVKLASQLAAGKIKSSTTGKTMTLGEGYKPLTRKDILVRFFEGKESPVASFVTGLMSGQTPTGEPMNIPSETVSRFIPLMVQDLYDLYNEHGPKGLAMGAPGVFGVGSQTYGKTEFVQGKNQLGEQTSQIRPLQDLPTKISSAVFGAKPLGTTSSFNAETYYNQLQKLPVEQKKAEFQKIAKTNPELWKKITDVIKMRQKGITVEDEQLKAKGVASGDRAMDIAKQLNKSKTKEERNKLYADMVRKGIITKAVAKQVVPLLKKY